MTRTEAIARLKQHVTSESLIKHCLAVEASMRGYAKLLGEDIERYGLTGLLHDIDFEAYPETHPMHARVLLEGAKLDAEILDAIEQHGEAESQRDTQLAKTLFAVDSLSSFVIAYVHVRPEKSFDGITLKSVKKKFKDKAFARAVDRELVRQGALELGVELDQHMTHVIEAIVTRQKELEVEGESLV